MKSVKEKAKLPVYVLVGLVIVILSSLIYFRDDSTDLSETSGNAAVETITGDAVGDACATTAQCGAGFYCKFNPFTKRGKCETKPLSDVEACQTDADCVAGQSSCQANICKPLPVGDAELEALGIKEKGFKNKLQQPGQPGKSHSISEVPGLLDVIKDIYTSLQSFKNQVTGVETKVTNVEDSVAKIPAIPTKVASADRADRAGPPSACTIVAIYIPGRSRTGPYAEACQSGEQLYKITSAYCEGDCAGAAANNLISNAYPTAAQRLELALCCRPSTPPALSLTQAQLDEDQVALFTTADWNLLLTSNNPLSSCTLFGPVGTDPSAPDLRKVFVSPRLSNRDAIAAGANPVGNVGNNKYTVYIADNDADLRNRFNLAPSSTGQPDILIQCQDIHSGNPSTKQKVTYSSGSHWGPSAL